MRYRRSDKKNSTRECRARGHRRENLTTTCPPAAATNTSNRSILGRRSRDVYLRACRRESPVASDHLRCCCRACQVAGRSAKPAAPWLGSRRARGPLDWIRPIDPPPQLAGGRRSRLAHSVRHYSFPARLKRERNQNRTSWL